MNSVGDLKGKWTHSALTESKLTFHVLEAFKEKCPPKSGYIIWKRKWGCFLFVWQRPPAARSSTSQHQGVGSSPQQPKPPTWSQSIQRRFIWLPSNQQQEELLVSWSPRTRRLALNLLACSKPQNLWQVDWLVGRWPGCGGTCRKMFSKKNLMNGTQADQLLSKDCQGLEGPSPADGQSSYPWCFFFPSTRVLKLPPLKPAPFCPSPSRLDIVCPWFCLLSECCSVFFSSFVFLSLVLMFAWLAVGLGLCIRFFWGLHLGLWPKCSKPSELSVSFFFSVSVILSFNQCYLHKH